MPLWRDQPAQPGEPRKVLVLIPGVVTSSQILWERLLKTAQPHLTTVCFEHPRSDMHRIEDGGSDAEFDHVKYAVAVLGELRTHLGEEFESAEFVLLLESAAVMTGLALLKLFRNSRTDLTKNVKLFLSESGLPHRVYVKVPRWLQTRLGWLATPPWLSRIVTKLTVPRRYILGAKPAQLHFHQLYSNSTPRRVRRAQLTAISNFKPEWVKPGTFRGVPFLDLRAQLNPKDLDGFVSQRAAAALCTIFGADPAEVSRNLPGALHGGHVEGPQIWDPAVLRALIDCGFLPADVQLAELD